ncbi:hypothetical protein IWW45_005746 [Coemansia sp. RSA 485]|nr:hypothetical protein IWW45_005746 [Coemansia sp. RSA 485]
MIPIRISFLSCAEVSQPALPWPSTPCTQHKSRSLDKRQSKLAEHTEEDICKDDGDESHEQAILRIWAPTQPAKPDKYTRRERARIEARKINDIDYSYIDTDNLLSVWVCPEVKKRVQKRKIQRERALLLAQRIIGPRNNTGIEQHNVEQSAVDECGLLKSRKKRRVSDSPVPDTPPSSKPVDGMHHSPELLKPQSLLIPELLPKGMFREQKILTAASKTFDTDMACCSNEVGQASMINGESFVSVDAQFADDQVGFRLGLGLDLGFDIGQSAPKSQSDGSDSNAIASSINEITRFLERDIDVFTPLTKTRTVKANNHSSFSAPLPPPPPPIDFASLLSAPTNTHGPKHEDNVQKTTDQAQDLISDILNMKF